MFDSFERNPGKYRILIIFLALIAVLLSLHGQAFSMGLTFPGTTTTPPPTNLINVSYLSSTSIINGNPTRLAIDKKGILYVANPPTGQILKYSQDGSPAGSINGFGKPLAVAVDDSGRIYVGDLRDGSVSVLGADGKLIGYLGRGRNEFSMPGDIAVASNSFIYVTDSRNNVVKVYNSDGTPHVLPSGSSSFGGYGVNAGQMIFPTGITSDDVNKEIYVVDQNNGRVEVFDYDGVYKRGFGSYGAGQGLLTRPQGISVAFGKAYVTDSFQSTVEVFDSRDGSFVAYIGQYGSNSGNLKVPSDVLVSGLKAFIANTDNGRIEVFEVRDPNGLLVNPSGLSFVSDLGTNPAGQNVQVDVQVAGTSVPWTATVAAPFTITPSQSTGTAPSTVSIGIDTTGIAAGTYTGTVNFRSGKNAVDYPLTVTLTIRQPQYLLVSPTKINMFHQIDGDLANTALSITSNGSGLPWAATAGASWLSLSPSSGVTPSSMTVSLNRDVQNLSEGLYNSSVTVTSSGAIGSPAIIPVTLKVMAAGSIVVKTNLDAASFTISGPSPNSGLGKTWRTDEAKPGSYTIQFGFIKGYRKPATRTFDLKSGKTVTLDVQYQPLEVANVIVATKGPGPHKNTEVRVVDLMGNLISEFRAFPLRNGGNPKYGAGVATVDIDGDGTSEILVTTGSGEENRAAMKVFRYDGTLLSSIGPIDHTQHGANVAAGDILGNGQHQVAMSMSMEDSDLQTIVIYQFSGYNLVEKARLSIPNKGDYPANLAFGDVDGDGILELIVSTKGGISIYAFNETLVPTLVNTGTVSLSGGKVTAYKSQMTVSAGDIAGDGFADIILGYDDGTDSYVGFFDDSLKPLGTAWKTFVNTKSAPTLSAMDTVGDGTADILVGKGATRDNDTTVRVYDASGTLLKEIRVFDAPIKFGVNAAFGFIKK